MPETVQADRVTGPYDVIVIIETESMEAISSVLHDRIHPINGITRTMSCLRFET